MQKATKGPELDIGQMTIRQRVNLARLASAARLGSLPPEVDYQGVLDAMYKSKADAVTADKELFDKINQELSWTPRAAPVRRGFWRFRRS
jgi:hypothetical protein